MMLNQEDVRCMRSFPPFPSTRNQSWVIRSRLPERWTSLALGIIPTFNYDSPFKQRGTRMASVVA
jgi:hypothetical protein